MDDRNEPRDIKNLANVDEYDEAFNPYLYLPKVTLFYLYLSQLYYTKAMSATIKQIVENRKQRRETESMEEFIRGSTFYEDIQNMPLCFDDKKNGDETDIDCGVTHCFLSISREFVAYKISPEEA